MAQVSQDTLRMEILREARERYEADLSCMSPATQHEERLLVFLKHAECDAMLRELMQPDEPVTMRTIMRDLVRE